MQRDARLQSLPIHILQGPSGGAPLKVPLTELPQRERDALLVEPLSSISQSHW